MANYTETMSIMGVNVAKRNFTGEERPMNQKGFRNFLAIVNPDLAAELSNKGWPVIALNPKQEGDEPAFALFVNVMFRYDSEGNLLSPTVWRDTKSGRVRLSEKTINKLDKGIIEKADMKVTFAHKDYNPRSGKPSNKIWLDKLVAFVQEDEFDSKYYDLENVDDEILSDEE